MIKKVAFTISLFLAATAMFAQGRLSGTVMDKDTKELLPFANVIAYQNGVQKGLSQTDFDGEYAVTPLDAGKYKIVATFVGMPNFVIEGVVITSGKTTRLNIEMSGDELQAVQAFGEKLIDVDETSVDNTLDAEAIDKAPTRSIAGLAATGASVSTSDDGSELNIAGNRAENNLIIVNGVKMNSSSIPGLAMASIKELQVITGGVPAEYGDATGGIINITTKVGSEKMAGSLKAETGAPFNAWNQSLGEFSLSGPIKTKTIYNELDMGGGEIVIDTVKETVVGFFLSGQYQYAKDPTPTVTKDTNGRFRPGIWTVKEDVLAEINENPLTPSGEGYLYSAEKVTFDDLELSKARPNVSRNSVQLNGSVEYYPNTNTTVSLGGFVDYQRYHGYITGYSLMNSSNNPLSNDLDYSLYGRFRQTFGAASSDDSSASLIKNAYYQVQLDYVNSSQKQEDDTHLDQYFRYGHVGNFAYSDEYVQATNGFSPGVSNYFHDVDNNLFNLNGDTMAVLSKDFQNIYVNTGRSDDSYTFTASEYNPLAGRYVSHFQELNGGDPIGLDQLQGNGLFRNGDRARQIHGLWFGGGREYNGFTRTNEEQYRLTGKASADVGDHNITFGFEYEQRNRSQFFVSPLNLWTLAGSQLNTHLSSGFDLEAGPTITEDGTDVYLNFNKAVVGTQTVFDKNLREKLGIAENVEINVDDLNPDDLNLGMFSANDLIQSSLVDYIGYDYEGNRIKGQKNSFEDFFYDTLERPQASFNPIYSAFYIQDKFEINDLIMRVGVRVDRYDANQVVLKDKYSTVALNSVGETDLSGFKNGDDLGSLSIQDDWVIYVDQSSEDLNNNQDNYSVVGFRDGDDWYDASGTKVRDYAFLEDAPADANPWFTFAQDVTDREEEIFNETGLDIKGAFEDYKPQINVMPRISFSFPVNEMATFFANYDVMTQRPNPDRTRVRPSDFYFLRQNGFINNPNLKPQQQNKYQLGFKQALDEKQTVAMTISGYYQERKNEIQFTRVKDAYPASYTTFDNIDFSTVKGGEIIFDTRRINNIKFNTSYTLSFADGTGSGATTAQTLVNQNFGNIKVPNALDFDQRHAFKVNLDWRLDSGKGPIVLGKKILSDFGINLQFNAGSGRPYTKLANSKTSAFLFGRNTLDGGINSSRLPWNYRANLKLDKEIYIGSRSFNVYMYVQNLFNTRNILSVYSQTGSPDDDGFLYVSPGKDTYNSESEIDLYLARLSNAGNYSLPRRIRVGASYYF